MEDATVLANLVRAYVRTILAEQQQQHSDGEENEAQELKEQEEPAQLLSSSGGETSAAAGSPAGTAAESGSEALSREIYRRYAYEIGPPYQLSDWERGRSSPTASASPPALPRPASSTGLDELPNPFATSLPPRPPTPPPDEEGAAPSWGTLIVATPSSEWALRDGCVVVGRTPTRGAQVVVSDRRVSGAHFRLTLRAGGDCEPILRDTSTNGTWLNGRRLIRGDDVPVFDGDHIAAIDPSMQDAAVGSFELRLGERAKPIPAPAPAKKKSRAPPPALRVGADVDAEAEAASPNPRSGLLADTMDVTFVLPVGSDWLARGQLDELLSAMHVLVSFASHELELGVEAAEAAASGATGASSRGPTAAAAAAAAPAPSARRRAAAASAAWMQCALQVAGDELEAGALDTAAAGLVGLLVHAAAHHPAELASCEAAGTSVRAKFGRATNALDLIDAPLRALFEAAAS